MYRNVEGKEILPQKVEEALLDKLEQFFPSVVCIMPAHMDTHLAVVSHYSTDSWWQ